jgi:two-component system, LytTR family, response regulator
MSSQPREDETPERLKPSDRPATRIAVKHKGRILFVNPDDILTVKAEGNYVVLQRELDSCVLRVSVSAIAEKLEPYGFVRVHRSALVNSPWVEEIRPHPSGEYRLLLRNGTELAVARTYRKNLRSLAELWLGKGPFPG